MPPDKPQLFILESTPAYMVCVRNRLPVEITTAASRPKRTQFQFVSKQPRSRQRNYPSSHITAALTLLITPSCGRGTLCGVDVIFSPLLACYIHSSVLYSEAVKVTDDLNFLSSVPPSAGGRAHPHLQLLFGDQGAES